MIVITGAAGFIGSQLVLHLNQLGYHDLILIDDFSRPEKIINLIGAHFKEQIDRENAVEQLLSIADQIECVFHLGARTDTVETDRALFDRLNVNYSKAIWTFCTEYQIPLIYASSAATYGLGDQGYDDDHRKVDQLQPLNEYGRSKQVFDQWVLTRYNTPPFWTGLKFFNVYGPNEAHKERMASVIFHTVRQIRSTGAMKLFRSHREDITDGHQARDFIYVKDITNICYWLYENQPASGIYNLGTGQARTFLDLVNETFKSLDVAPAITFIDTPADLRDKYQYFTEANIKKLRQAGYDKDFYTLEEGVNDYVSNYLILT